MKIGIPASLILYLFSLMAAPLVPGIINRVKARFGGRRGQPLLQPYYDLARLIRKGFVYSRTTTALIYWGPLLQLAALGTALTLLPLFPGVPPLLSMPGDYILLFYLLALGRLFTILAAMDTGSAFEGMGANREALFSALAEPALFIILATLVHRSGFLSLSQIFVESSAPLALPGAEVMILMAALYLILLSENARIPVDDPNTHLELTMIHEVMVLDHAGPDLAVIQYGVSLKLWLFMILLCQIVLSVLPNLGVLMPLLWLAALLIITISIGIVESTMARLQMRRVPQLLVAASALALVAYIVSR